jgi:hypothetical protein
MGNNNEKSISPEDRDLFHKITQDIKDNPSKYHEAGKWLDEYCSEEAYWRRQEKELEELRRKEREFPIYPIPGQVRDLEQEIEKKRTPALLLRFQEARDYLLEKYKDQPFIPENDAKKIIIIVWLLTDPDAEKSNLNITELENWSWEPLDDVTKLSRGYANFLWFYGGKVYNPWMKLVCVAWEKLKDKKKRWYQTSMFKYVVIPLVCALIVAIPAYIMLFRPSSIADRGTEIPQGPTSITDSPQEVEEKPEGEKPIVTEPTLSLISQSNIEHTTILLFKTSKKPLSLTTFGVTIIGSDSVRIMELSDGAYARDESQEISENGKEGRLTFSPGDSDDLSVTIKTSGACMLRITGSHLTEPVFVRIE